jgi:hypothetical protein
MVRYFIICILLYIKYYGGEKLSRMRWTGSVACMGNIINAYNNVVKNPKEESTWADQIVDER